MNRLIIIPPAVHLGVILGLFAVLAILWAVRQFETAGQDIDRDITEDEL